MQLAFYNHHSVERTIINCMVAVGASGTLTPALWVAGQTGIVVPAGANPSPPHAPGRAITSVFGVTSIPAADGFGPYVMRRASMAGCAWSMSPGQNNGAVWDSAGWAIGYPDAPMQSYVRWNGDFATPGSAGDANGWTIKSGRASVALPVYLHSNEHWGLIHVGDSTGGADLTDPPHVNHLGPLWRAVRDLAKTGARISYANLCQGGSTWTDQKRQLQTALDAGWVGPKRMVAMQAFTSNEALSAAAHLAKMQEMVSMIKAAGGKPLIVGPMCSESNDNVRLEIRAALQAGTETWLDVGGTIGRTDNPSIFAANMCGDPIGSRPLALGVHQSLAANVALTVPAKAMIQGVIA